MTDDLVQFLNIRAPSAERPLQGLTVLVVEDSRFASEAIRLLCLRSGARIRRADSLATAHRHLRVYRPSVVIVDMGLPDGSGAELIAELDRTTPRVTVILAMSGDADTEPAARRAGADGFFAKPMQSLAAFQQMVLGKLRHDGRIGATLRVLPSEEVHPDEIAFHDDLAHVAEILNAGADSGTIDYVAQFLGGVARSAHDDPLEQAAASLARSRAEGRGFKMDLARVAGIVQERLLAAGAL